MEVDAIYRNASLCTACRGGELKSGATVVLFH
jgi:hypothetical protein